MEMQLIVITPDTLVNGEKKIVNALFANGLQRLHVRKPLFPTADYRNYLNDIDPQYHSRVVLHGCFELLAEFELGGLHLNSMTRDDRDIGILVSALSPSFISASFHAWHEIRHNRFQYGYVFISPVFDSISKREYKAKIDLNGAKEMKREMDLRDRYCPALIALGGVGQQQIASLHQHGFDGAALHGSIWTSPDPVAAWVTARDITTSL